MGHRPMATTQAFINAGEHFCCSHGPVAHAGERLQFFFNRSKPQMYNGYVKPARDCGIASQHYRAPFGAWIAFRRVPGATLVPRYTPGLSIDRLCKKGTTRFEAAGSSKPTLGLGHQPVSQIGLEPARLSGAKAGRYPGTTECTHGGNAQTSQCLCRRALQKGSRSTINQPYHD
jgi:hypothetical protein